MSGEHRNFYREFRYRSFDGLMLAARDYGGPTCPGLPVVCLPGLSRSVRDFHALAGHLSDERHQRRRVIAFDYRGRGASDRDPNWQNYTVPTEAGDVLDGLAGLGIHRAVFVGTSRGGLIVMTIATLRPGAIAAAILNDIGPVIEAEGLVRIKTVLGAMHDPINWAIAADQLRRLYGESFPALDGDDWRAFAEATYRSENGMPKVDFDPALIRTLAGVKPDRPPPALWPQFAALREHPILVLRGAQSDLLSRETLEAMGRLHPRLETMTVPGQGHPPQLTSPELLEAIGDFIDASIDEPLNPVRSAGTRPGFLRR